MSLLPVYLDASALLKLIVPERESDSLAAALHRWPDRVSCAIVRVEVHRALKRLGGTKAARHRADAVLDGVILLGVDAAVIARAGLFRNPNLRALDALHLAAALSIGDEPEAFVTYDARLAAAAQTEGLIVLHPGVEKLKPVK